MKSCQNEVKGSSTPRPITIAIMQLLLCLKILFIVMQFHFCAHTYLKNYFSLADDSVRIGDVILPSEINGKRISKCLPAEGSCVSLLSANVFQALTVQLYIHISK